VVVLVVVVDQRRLSRLFTIKRSAKISFINFVAQSEKMERKQLIFLMRISAHFLDH